MIWRCTYHKKHRVCKKCAWNYGVKDIHYPFLQRKVENNTIGYNDVYHVSSSLAECNKSYIPIRSMKNG